MLCWKPGFIVPCFATSVQQSQNQSDCKFQPFDFFAPQFLPIETPYLYRRNGVSLRKGDRCPMLKSVVFERTATVMQPFPFVDGMIRNPIAC